MVLIMSSDLSGYLNAIPTVQLHFCVVYMPRNVAICIVESISPFSCQVVKAHHI